METIKFTSPLIKYASKNPWYFDEKYFDDIPPIPGVYIVGVKIPVIGQEEKFCPLYVGISNNLQSRLKEHHNNKIITKTGGYLNSRKDLFDIVNEPIQNVYSDIEIFNQFKNNKNLYDPYNLSSFDAVKINHNSLIWYPDAHFFDNYLNVQKLSEYPLKDGRLDNVGHFESIRSGGDLDSIHKKDSACGADGLKIKILEVKNKIENNFYFIYATLDSISTELSKDENAELFQDAVDYRKNKIYSIPGNKENGVKRQKGPGMRICEKVESTTKEALKGIGIHTYGAVSVKNGVLNIDLSDIQNDLVNMTGAPFINLLKI